jgi:glutathionylspermidine synthase
VRRVARTPRPDFAKKLESIGLSFHSWDEYWKEDVCYQFTAAQVDELEQASQELHAMCLEAVDQVIRRGRLGQLGIPDNFWHAIAHSWAQREPSLYGRFDLAYDGISAPKMLEYNADTPTSLLESAVAQWYWLEDTHPHADQFNSLHERLVERFGAMGLDQGLTIASSQENEEDWVCTHYLLDCATQAGVQAQHMVMEDIGWDATSKCFVDLSNKPIAALFKLYPWEWLMREEFGPHIAPSSTRFIEPIWKSVLACKGILPVLWELFPGHPNLLESYVEPRGMQRFAKKPLYSREGANVQLIVDGITRHQAAGPYGEEGYVYQALANMPVFDGQYPVIGAWIVGDTPAGICIREDATPITTNLSHFVPHFFE